MRQPHSLPGRCRAVARRRCLLVSPTRSRTAYPSLQAAVGRYSSKSMQGILTASLDPAPPAPERANLPPRLSSFNLARHTTAHPPAPRRTVEQYLASVAPVHAAGAYEVGPPAEDEFDHVRTPPRAVEARRKRRLEDIEDRGESWIRSPARTSEEALVLIRPDSLSRSEEGVRAKRATTSQPARKPSLVAAMKGRTSHSAARKVSQVSAPQSRPPSPLDAASDRSSVLVPRNPKLADRPFDHAAGPRERDEKEAEPGKSQETKRRSGRKAPRADYEETGELEEHEAREVIFRSIPRPPMLTLP